MGAGVRGRRVLGGEGEGLRDQAVKLTGMVRALVEGAARTVCAGRCGW